MDEFLLVASIFLFLASLFLPTIAFVLIYTTRKRLRKVEQELEQRERELRYLYELSKKAPEPVSTQLAEEPPTAPVRPADPQPAPQAPPPAQAPPQAPPPQDSPPLRAPAPDRAPTPEPISPPPRAPAVPLEQRLATIFTRVGAGALLLGLLYFFKYAVDNEWIGPMGRVLVGAAAGVAFLVFAEVIRPRTKPAYVSAVVGIGLACLYISAYASSAFYHLIPTEAAFAANAIILLLGAALAWRHQGEAILVLVSIAGFLNPVLLSTGVDRPAALFTYLLVMTSVVLFVATQHGFRIAIPLAMLGVAVLFTGWYERFFEVYDLTGTSDLPPEQLVGAYHAMPARIVPLAAVLLFSIQWIAVSFRLRQIEKLPRFVVPIAVASLILAHAGITALLFDRAIHLGVAMIVLGAGSVIALRALNATRHLLFPMLAAFLLLLGLTERAHDWNQKVVVALLGVWTAVYTIAFLRDFSAAHREITTAQGVRAGIALGSFAILASSVLLPNEEHVAAQLAIVGASAAIAVVAHRAKLPWMNLIALAGTFIPMSVAAYQAIRYGELFWDPISVGTGLLWAIAFGAGPMLAALREAQPRTLHVFSLALAELAFLALALIASSHESVPTMRAVLTAFAGIVSLGIATLLARVRPELHLWKTVMAALALGLFAPAIAFALSGATITVLWAILTGVAALILAESRQRVWTVTVIGLAVATLCRVVFVDIQDAHDLMSMFRWSAGREGVLALPAFFNARAYALFGTGFAFLGGAFLLGRSLSSRPDKMIGGLAGTIAIAAYTLLTIGLITEVRAALLELPPVPPIYLDREEFEVFMTSVHQAEVAQHNLLAMASTVVLAIVAFVLLGIGFAAKDPFHRYLGLTVFLGTIVKLVGWDVWNLARIYQVGALTFVGALLVGSGFLYARIKNLFKATAASLILFAFAPSARAETDTPQANPVPIHEYTHRRAIEGVTARGDHAVRIDAELYQHSKSENLFDDVRIADARGREVPFVVRLVPPELIPDQERGRMYDPQELPFGGFRATFEIPRELEHCKVRLELHGPAPYLRRTKIETGNRSDDLQLVAEGGLVWALYEQSRSTLDYPRSIARYVRITLMPDPNASRTTITGAEFGCDGPRSLPPSSEIPIAIVEQRQQDKTTIIELDAGIEGLPLEEITLDVVTPEFARRATLAASSYKSVWPVVSRGVIHRYGNEPGWQTLSANGTRKRWFQATIENGDDAPLEIRGAKARLLSREIVFRVANPGPHTLYIGSSPSFGPRYDLAGLIERAETRPLPATFGAIEPNPAHGKPEVAGDLPITEKHRTAIGAVLAVLLIGLAVWAVMLIRAR